MAACAAGRAAPPRTCAWLPSTSPLLPPPPLSTLLIAALRAFFHVQTDAQNFSLPTNPPSSPAVSENLGKNTALLSSLASLASAAPLPATREHTHACLLLAFLAHRGDDGGDLIERGREEGAATGAKLAKEARVKMRYGAGVGIAVGLRKSFPAEHHGLRAGMSSNVY